MEKDNFTRGHHKTIMKNVSTISLKNNYQKKITL